MIKPILTTTTPNIAMVDYDQFLDGIKKINWIENAIEYKFSLVPEYPSDYFTLFGLVPCSYLGIHDMCLKYPAYKKLRKFFINEGFVQYTESNGGYKYFHPSRKILIYGDIDTTPENLDIDEETEFGISFCPLATNKEFMIRLSKMLKKCFFKKIKHKNNFYMVAQGERGLYNHETTFKPIPIKDNRFDLFYGKDFPHEKLLQFVNEDTDNLLLLHGDPGTGKSNYIKHLIYNSPRNVIYIPPSMLSVISTPGFISYIMNNAGSLLLIEDAEEVLSTDRNSATNNLLGITDGFLKDCLDLKVICTFNCEFGKIDDALTRKGRLFFEYKFNPLSVEDSNELANFCNLERTFNTPSTLAEIFNKEDNTSQNSFEERRMGFQ